MARDKLSIEKSDASDEVPEMAVLKPKQAAFVREFTGGKFAGNAAKSILAAGYETNQAGAMACAIQKNPRVAAAIDAVLRAEISQKLTIQAVSLIRRVLSDDNAPLKIRADMASKVIEISGIARRIDIEKANETGLNSIEGGPKRLGEMTRQELEAIVQSGAAILQAAAALPPQTIEATPSDAAKDIRSKPERARKSLMATTG